MPTILAIFGLRVVIYPNDHRPAHVHVIGNGCEVVFKLHCPYGPPELRENLEFSQKEAAKIANRHAISLALLCHEWKQLHGHY
jgi:hypothetical protein